MKTMRAYLNCTLLCVSLFVLTSAVLSQQQTVDTAFYPELHQMLLESKLTQYQCYHGDSLIYQWQDPSCPSDTVQTASLMKSLTGMAVGALLKGGFIPSLEEPVCTYVPEWKSGCEQAVTIRHLLTMTSGLKKRSLAGRSEFFTSDDWNALSVSLSLDTVPGAVFSYSNEAAQLLEPVIARASGMSSQEFFQRYVLDPLDMPNTTLLLDDAGHTSVVGGAQTTLQDLSHVGMAVLNQGRYQGVQVLDATFLAKAFAPIAQNPYYGFLWWVDEQNECYTAMGDGGVMMIVFPEKDLIFLRAHNCKEGPYVMDWMSGDYVRKIGQLIIEN